MRIAGDVQATKNASFHSRTVVPGERISRPHILRPNHIYEFFKSLVRKLTRPRVLIVFAVIFAIFAVLIVFYYNEFAREIDARLKGNFLDNSLGIYSAPIKISAGDRLPLEDLISYLRTGGYQQQTGASQNRSPAFEVDRDSILVYPGDGDQQSATNSFRIRIDK